MPILDNNSENIPDYGFFDTANAIAPYILQDQSISYEGDTGMLQIPVGAPPSLPQKVPCKIVRAHAPVMRKIVTYLYQRLAALPRIPTPEPNDSNQVLIEHRRIPMSPVPWGNGDNMLYSVMGEYVYALYTPIDTADGMPIGLGPAFSDNGDVDLQIDVDDYAPPV